MKIASFGNIELWKYRAMEISGSRNIERELRHTCAVLAGAGCCPVGSPLQTCPELGAGGGSIFQYSAYNNLRSNNTLGYNNPRYNHTFEITILDITILWIKKAPFSKTGS